VNMGSSPNGGVRCLERVQPNYANPTAWTCDCSIFKSDIIDNTNPNSMVEPQFFWRGGAMARYARDNEAYLTNFEYLDPDTEGSDATGYKTGNPLKYPAWLRQVNCDVLPQGEEFIVVYPQTTTDRRFCWTDEFIHHGNVITDIVTNTPSFRNLGDNPSLVDANYRSTAYYFDGTTELGGASDSNTAAPNYLCHDNNAADPNMASQGYDATQFQNENNSPPSDWYDANGNNLDFNQPFKKYSCGTYGLTATNTAQCGDPGTCTA